MGAEGEHESVIAAGKRWLQERTDSAFAVWEKNLSSLPPDERKKVITAVDQYRSEQQ